MCLAVPMQIKKIEDDVATAEYNGVATQVNIALTPDIIVGDKVLVHAGFIIEKLDEAAAKEIEDAWQEYEKAMQN